MEVVTRFVWTVVVCQSCRPDQLLSAPITSAGRGGWLSLNPPLQFPQCGAGPTLSNQSSLGSITQVPLWFFFFVKGKRLSPIYAPDYLLTRQMTQLKRISHHALLCFVSSVRIALKVRRGNKHPVFHNASLHTTLSSLLFSHPRNGIYEPPSPRPWPTANLITTELK